MDKIINKQTLEKLVELARIEISANENKLLKELEGILEHFNELKEVDVSDVKPMSGTVELINIFRDDEPIKSEAEAIDLIDAFSKKEKGFLKVPAVFE